MTLLLKRRTGRTKDAARRLTGWHEYQLDRKGRVVLPQCWVRRLRWPLAVTPLPEARLCAFPAGGTEPDDARLIGQPCPTTRRITLPHLLRQHADLYPGCPVILIGRGDCFEIISRERWLREQREAGS